MKKFLQEKPWYFATVVLGLILQPIIEWFVMYFFDEEAVKKWLDRSVLISDIIPWALCAIIFLCVQLCILFSSLELIQKLFRPTS